MSMPEGGWHRNGLADPDNPKRYVRSRTGLLHIRAVYGIVEEDGMSYDIGECGWQAPDSHIYSTPLIGADGHRLCKRCIKALL